MPNQPMPFYVKLCCSLISILLITYILYVGQHILIPLAFASLFTIILIGPCMYFEKRGVPKGIAALISMLLAATLFFFIFYFISSQISSFKNDLPALVKQLQAGVLDVQDWAVKTFRISSSKFQEVVNSATNEAFLNTSALLSSTFSTVSSTLVLMVLVPIYTFLLLLYRNLIVKFFVTCFKPEHEKLVFTVLHKTRLVVKGYVVGLFIEMIIVAVINCTGFLILGVKYALLLGVIAAILNLIPYLGIFTACILTVLITLTTNTPATVLSAAIMLIGVHLIDSNILLPKIVGSKVKLNALVTIIGVIAGSALWGIPGMFLAIPIIAVLKVLFDEVQSLNAWGMLLGEEEKPAKKKKSTGLFSWFMRKDGKKKIMNKEE